MTSRIARVLRLLVLLALGCGSANQDKYKDAAIGTGIAIAATGVHRAVTKDCWGRCSPGYLCNEESGFCELGECMPACEVGSHCVRDARDLPYCARDPGLAPPHPANTSAAPPPSPLQNLPMPGTSVQQ